MRETYELRETRGVAWFDSQASSDFSPNNAAKMPGTCHPVNSNIARMPCQEGGVTHVIAKHCGSGGVRWIRQRAQALLWLRCIEINGDGAAFIHFVHERTTNVAGERHGPR